MRCVLCFSNEKTINTLITKKVVSMGIAVCAYVVVNVTSM